LAKGAVHKLLSYQTEEVTTERLGKAKLPQTAHEQPNGKPIVINTDYFGNTRKTHPQPGPFETIKEGNNNFKVW
jgi:hypothetical protein